MQYITILRAFSSHNINKSSWKEKHPYKKLDTEIGNPGWTCALAATAWGHGLKMGILFGVFK
jgi:hypothetical protein